MTAPRSLFLLAAATMLACGGPAEGPVVPGPHRAAVTLTDADIRAIAQVLRFEDTREFDASTFDRLAGGSEEVRRRVATAAGRIGDTDAVGLLVRLLDDDPSTAVRADAAFALGQLGDTSRVVLESLREAVPGGWVPVRDPETDVVVEVVHALGKLGSFRARSMVVEALREAHPGDSRNARRVAAEGLLSLWRFEEGPGRVNAAVRYLDLDDDPLRWRAAYALMRLGEPEGGRHLLGLLDDPDHRTRAYAARGLSPAVVDSAGIRDSVVVALTATLTDPHPHVRINAVRGLGGFGEDAPVDAMAALLGDPDPNVAVAAAGALTSREPATEALAAVVSDVERPMAVRAAAAGALAPLRPDAVVTYVRRWADGPVEDRYAAARTLSGLDWTRAGGVLRELAADPDLRVSVAATVAAGQFAADTALSGRVRNELQSFLRELATGESRRLAMVAVRGLEPLLEDEALDRLRVETGVADPDGDDGLGDRGAAFYEEMVRTYVAPVLAGDARPRAVIRTTPGEIHLELLSEESPLTVHNFITLAADGFWDDGVWHRVVPNFVIQDGAPAGDPSGGPGWRIRDEINRVRYTRGVMGMALAGPDTGGSQWFITHSPQHHLDGGYTVFGRVVDGMDVIDRVLRGDLIAAVGIP